MVQLTAMDEYFVHQIPEPLPHVVTHHPHWRESLFFVLHPRDEPGDVVILTLAHFPVRGEMDSLQLGHVGGVPTIQSGTYSGWYRHRGTTYEVDRWWGQRDHSWGIRDHQRCPFWMWLAIQLPDGMLGAWHWELANGARIFTDGCWSPALAGGGGGAGGSPTPVVDLRHDLRWGDADGETVDYGRDGDDVAGVAGRLELTLAGGDKIGVEADGRWAQRYGPLGGGLNQVRVRTDDGREGTAIIELTGAHHHRYFPVARADELPG